MNFDPIVLGFGPGGYVAAIALGIEAVDSILAVLA